MENEHRHITSVILNLKSWKFVRNMMINNIQLKLTKLLSFKNIGKGLISIALITSILVSPFSIHAETSWQDNLGMIPAYQFFTGMYNCKALNDQYLAITSTATNNQGTVIEWETLNGQIEDHILNTSQIFPIMSAVNSWSRYSSYSSSKRIRVTSNPLYIVFHSSTNFTTSNIHAYSESNSATSITRVTGDLQTPNTPNNYYFIVLKLQATTVTSKGYNYVTIDLPGTTATTIIPLYYGTQEYMPDNIHRMVFGYGQTFQIDDSGIIQSINDLQTDLHTEAESIINAIQQMHFNNDLLNQQILDANLNSASYLYDIRTDTGRILNLLNNGTSSSQSASNNLDNVSDDLADQVQNLNDVNQSLENDMSSSLNNLDTNSLLMQSQQFTKGMSWLKARFNTMFLNNPFGWYIQISLIIGIAMFMIGRYRK